MNKAIRGLWSVLAFVGMAAWLADSPTASAQTMTDSSAKPTVSTQSAGKAPSRIAYPVQLEIQRLQSAGKPEVREFTTTADEGAKTGAPAEIELVFHAASPTTAAQNMELVALGARIVEVMKVPETLKLPPVGMIQAWIPVDAVERAAALPWVVAVTAPDHGETNPHPNNAIDSEGVPLHNADDAHDQGVIGTGVNVGAISDGVANLAASQALNELPAVTVLSVGSGDEGTAMLELIHDMAPGASLFFHTTGGGTAGHVTAVANLLAAGVNVISEDLAYDREPAFQQGVVAAAREAAASAGVPVHSSSGNRGTNHTARVVANGTGSGPDGYNGAFTGCGIDPTNVVAIAPGGDTTFDMTVGANTRFTLQWSEPRAIFPTAGAGGFTDLDLYVMDSTGTQCLAVSTASQGGGVGDTIETIGTSAFGIAAGTQVKLVVNVFGSAGAAAAPTLDLRWRGSQSQQDVPTRAGSNDPDKNYTGLAYVIGAVNAGSGMLEGFSSAGPVDLRLTTVCPGGAYPCPAGVPGPSASYQGLDFLGADGTSVSGVGGFGAGTCPANNQGDCLFFGTSAAAPHTAACDALVRSLPSFGAAAAPATTRARLAATAVDFPPAGEDSTTGAGQLDCFAAIGPPEAICADRTVPTNAGVCVATGVSVDNGSNDPFGQGITVVESPEDPYSLGATLVSLTVTDDDGLTDMCSANVTVEDQEPPTITAPGDIQQECAAPEGTPVDLGLPSGIFDNCDADPAVTNDAPGLFPLGQSTVTWTATDDSGNFSTSAQQVTIVDTTPPELSVSVSPDSLWPPNHKLVSISVTAVATDICDADPEVRLVSATSNEPDNGRGDGNTTGDIVIIDDFTIELRAERSGRGSGRVYTLTYEAEDDSGNTTQVQATVTVPKSRR